ncbi:MAG TPA: zinc ribbon domain-containing protein [Gemmatimonadaceae bacterium]|nr:zinc ribbon domain-containing protein [Gemmatimonadaceae bacterium]
MPTPATCPSCNAPSTGGRFCSSCGAPFEGAVCAACRSSLSAGAKFCHRCGAAVGSRPSDPRVSATLPWAVASIAVVALVALVAGRSIGARRVTPAAAPSADTTAEEAQAPVRAPDISSMSPGERADRLYDRVMRLHEEGKDDSVRFFSPMVMQAYQMLGPLDADQHYDLGRIAEVLGMGDLAKAEADTILKAQPTHLLGLTLAARVSTPDKKRDFYKRLLAAEPAERKKALPEYDRHKDDIDAALATARGEQRA